MVPSAVFSRFVASDHRPGDSDPHLTLSIEIRDSAIVNREMSPQPGPSYTRVESRRCVQCGVDQHGQVVRKCDAALAIEMTK